MPRYKIVDAPTYIDSTMRQPGDIVEYEGWPGSTLEPADDVAKRVKEFHAVNRGSRKLPRRPDLATFAEPKPAKADGKPAAKPVKDE